MQRCSIVSAACAAAVALLHGPGLVRGACNFDKIDVTTNPGFKITVSDDYKVLEDTSINTKYGLYCADTQPSVDGIDRWFKVPIMSVGIRLPIASGFLEALGKRSSLTAAEAPANITNICVDASKLATLGDAGGDSNGSNKVDVVFSSSADSDGNKSVRLPSDDSLTPLQKAEWIKFVAAFFNAEKSADALYSSITDAYNCHWNNLQHLSSKPHAYWVQYTASDTSASDKPTYNVVDSAYQKDLLAGAGTTSATSAPLSDPTDQSAFQAAVKDADFVFDQTNLTKYGQRLAEWHSDFGYTDPQNSGASFLQLHNIWRTDGYTSENGVSNFPEFAYVRPDLVLQDIISIVEPLYNSTYLRHWMLWLGGSTEKTVVIGSDNYNCGSPWLTQVDGCSARSDFTGEDAAESGNASDSIDDGKEDGDDKESSGHSSRAGKIAGGVVAAAVFVGLVLVAMHYINRHRRRARIRALAEAGVYGGESIGLHNTSPRRFS
ncbi:hypothetical protein BX070DRAFT_234946 [Coemansia spiralis]|nr:hypothetical protein BX070DRAFT_234946 [Coemansia spiralis]